MIKKLFSGEFNRNVLTLFTGTTIAQAIPVAISPVLTRIYTPEDFGVLALFISLSAIFGSIVNGRYELAIVLPENDEDAINVAALCVIVAFISTILLFAIVILFNSHIALLLDNKEIKKWLFLVPLEVFFIGLFNVLTYLNIRTDNFADISKSKVLKGVFGAAVQIAAGFFSRGAAGLIWGNVTSYFAGNARLGKNIFSAFDVRNSVSIVKIKLMAVRYVRFPKYSMGAILANSLSYNITSILIPSFFSISTLGMYSMANRILGMPSNIIGTAIGQVFFQEATREKNETGRALKIFDSTFKKLIFMSVPGFGVLYFIVEDMFAIVFGEEWRTAGVYARIMIPFFAIRFVVSPLTLINSSFERQDLSLLWQLFLLFSITAVFIIMFFYGMTIEIFLKIFTAVTAFDYAVLFVIIRLIASGKLSIKRKMI